MTPSAEPVARARRRRWLILGATAWAVLLAVLAVFSQRHEPATVPEQRSLAAALPAVDRATGAVVAAVGTERAFLLGPVVVRRDCRITPVRPGAEAIREVTVYVAPGAEAGTLDAVAAALPQPFHASVLHLRGGTKHELSADAGDFIAVHGDAADATITLRVRTGCRPIDDAGGPVVPSDRSTATAGSTVDPRVSAQFDRARAALRLRGHGAVTTTKITTAEVTCPDGGTARTVAVDGFPAPADLRAALAAAAPASAVVRGEAKRYVYRVGGVSVIATVADGTVRLAASSGC